VSPYLPEEAIVAEGNESIEYRIGHAAQILAEKVSRRTVLGSALAVVLGAIAAACGASGSSTTPASAAAASQAASAEASAAPSIVASGGGKKKVALLLPSYVQVRWKAADQAYFEKTAAELGVFDVIFQQANNKADTQLAQVENVLTQGIDVLVLCPADVDAGKEMVRRANAANVPVVSYNYSILDVDVAALISRDAVEVGRDLARAFVQAVPKGNYINVFLPDTLSVGRDKAQGTLEILKPFVDSGAIKVVGQQYILIDDLAGNAQKFVEATLTANNNDIQAVICHNNDMEYGTMAALTAQKLNGKVQTEGEDAETHALNLIYDGSALVESFTQFNVMGTEAAKAAAAIITGQPVATTDTFDNNFKKVPWVKIAAVNVVKDDATAARMPQLKTILLEQFVKDYPWWIDAKVKQFPY
jgi:D-xylose transport system substrate-binding protein